MSSEGGRRKATVVLAAVVLLGVFGYFMMGQLQGNVVLFRTPAELVALGNKAYDVPMRIGGQVEPGSVQWNAEALDLRFRVKDSVRSVLVHSKGAPPQMFRDGMGVVIEGKYSRDGTFESTNLLIKHSEEYRAPKNGEMPQQMYKTLVKDLSS
jgi:cytochrome c-type biogenesis protein CcmE